MPPSEDIPACKMDDAASVSTPDDAHSAPVLQSVTPPLDAKLSSDSLTAVEEWEQRIAIPRRAALAAKAAELAQARTEARDAAARAAEVDALADHTNKEWRGVGRSAAVRTLHALQLFATEERLIIKKDREFLDAVQLTPQRACSPLLSKRRAAVKAFVAERRRSV